MSKYQDGEHLDLDWGDFDPQALYVRGHVTPEAFRAAIAKRHGEEFVDQALAPFGEPVHRYGRWSREGGDEDFGNGRCVLRPYDEPGRGRFKVTEAKRNREGR